MPMKITRRVELDAGHRVPSHAGKCSNAHGHRYVVEATVSGDVMEARGESDDGMVVDFSILKQVMTSEIVDLWDHAFLVFVDDVPMRDALDLLASRLAVTGKIHRTVVLPFIPTAENLAAEAFRRLSGAIEKATNNVLRLEGVRVYETPNSWADCSNR